MKLSIVRRCSETKQAPTRRRRPDRRKGGTTWGGCGVGMSEEAGHWRFRELMHETYTSRSERGPRKRTGRKAKPQDAALGFLRHLKRCRLDRLLSQDSPPRGSRCGPAEEILVQELTLALGWVSTLHSS